MTEHTRPDTTIYLHAGLSMLIGSQDLLLSTIKFVVFKNKYKSFLLIRRFFFSKLDLNLMIRLITKLINLCEKVKKKKTKKISHNIYQLIF